MRELKKFVGFNNVNFGYAQIRIPASERRRLKVVSCDPQYDVLEMTLDIVLIFTAWSTKLEIY